MKKPILFYGIIISLLVFTLAIPSVFATNNYTNDDATTSTSSFSVNTTYEAGTYIQPIEVYNVDLEWDDLHWIFIYSGDITNPTTKVWMTKVQYDYYRNGANTNDFNKTILNNINQYKNKDEVKITVTNHSEFSVDIVASIEQKNATNYTNSAVLQVIEENGSTWSSSQSSVEDLAKNATSFFKVRPQANRYVNDTGTTVSVTGEVKLTFTKS